QIIFIPLALSLRNFLNQSHSLPKEKYLCPRVLLKNLTLKERNKVLRSSLTLEILPPVQCASSTQALPEREIWVHLFTIFPLLTGSKSQLLKLKSLSC